MKSGKHLAMLVVVLAVLVGSMGLSAQTAQAASCRVYHTVQRGQSLSVIGAYYGVYWKDIANANGISSPYTIYPGQSLCIPSGGYTYYPSYGWTQTYSWQIRVVGVVKNTSVTIQTANFPDNMLYNVEIGCSSCGIAAIDVGDLDSDAGGTFKKVYSIPEEFSGVSNLWIRLTQVNKNKAQTAYFYQ